MMCDEMTIKQVRKAIGAGAITADEVQRSLGIESTPTNIVNVYGSAIGDISQEELFKRFEEFIEERDYYNK
jgi:hypothetical protein